MSKLHAFNSNFNAARCVDVSYKIYKDKLICEFFIQSSPLFVSHDFSNENYDNWGLWDYDVAEVFVQRAKQESHYLELQVSPLSQKFALNVKTPRESFEKVELTKSSLSAETTEKGFRALFEIDISEIPGESNMVYGNFHACLGSKEKRDYYGLSIQADESPDFHQPQNFVLLGEI